MLEVTMSAIMLWAVVLFAAILTTQAQQEPIPGPESEFVVNDGITLSKRQQEPIPPGPEDDFIIDGGDIKLTREQYAWLYGEALNNISKRSGAKSPELRWTDATMPYRLMDDTFNTKETYEIKRALTEWERYTCMYFRPATKQDKNHAYYENGSGCLSQLGMVGGRQYINLGSGCRFKGLYLHETGHALGLIHEHQRHDRDNWVTVVESNVDPNLLSAFKKYTNTKYYDDFGSTYEYSSIMHYETTAFCRNGFRACDTMRVKYPDRKDEVSYVSEKELAYGDVLTINKMYNCAAKCPNQNKCGRDGHLNENCDCICRDGTSDCDTTKRTHKDPGCKNSRKSSWSCYIWANQGECERNPDKMRDCEKACGKCGKRFEKQSGCKDKYKTKKCEGWRWRGDCGSNPEWMKANCAKTCNFCGSRRRGCKDRGGSGCKAKALKGECGSDAKSMLSNCALSCGNCDGKRPPPLPAKSKNCRDSAGHRCVEWSTRGECGFNTKYMHENCKKSCDNCDGANSYPPWKEGVCEDHLPSTQCYHKKLGGQCEDYEQYMQSWCKKACGFCTGGGNTGRDNGRDKNRDKNTNTGGGACKDGNRSCPAWTGSCSAPHIRKMCKKSCGAC